MQFFYKAITSTGENTTGTIDSVNMDGAINLLQAKGLVISSISPQKQGFSLANITIFNRVSNKDIVVLSRQIATLFDAQVSALRVFLLVASQEENPMLKKNLQQVADDLQGGSSISKALAKHPNVFSPFYINMVRAGEESGKLDQTFVYLADYLDRTYEVSSKAKNALIYPAFVVGTFVVVMVLMFTLIVPKIGAILADSGQELPFYTKIVLGTSDFLISYGFLLLALAIVGAFFLWRYTQTEEGRKSLDSFRLHVPYIGTLYKKLFLSRIADNTHTLISSGVTMVKSLEITASVVGSVVYKNILDESLAAIKGGKSLSAALADYKEIPVMMTQMIRVGEETGELGNILKTLSNFYQREVVRAVDTLVDLIEPVMIVVLGLGVGLLIASILVPIYNITSAF